MLALKCILNHLNLSSVEKVMAICLRLRRMNRNYARLCSTLLLGTLLCESCFVSYMKVLVGILCFSYWGFTSYLEVGSERYGFSNGGYQMVTWVNIETVIFGSIFRSLYIIMGIARKLQNVVSLTSLFMYRSLLGFENWVKWVWKWNLESEQSNNSKSVSFGPS